MKEMSPDELATKQDLINLKNELIKEYELLLERKVKAEKEFLRTKEVMEILSIKPTSVRNFIEKGILKPKKIESINYFLLSDIRKLFA